MFKKFINSRPLTSFFILSYLISWIIWIPGILAYRLSGSEDLSPALIVLGLLGAFGPSFAAIIITKLQGNSIKSLFKAPGALKINKSLLLFIIFNQAVLLLLGYVLLILLERKLGTFEFALSFIPIILVTILTKLPFGPLGEELGWRGYALPKLQEKYSPLFSSIIIGFFWTFWHTPMFWVKGAALSYNDPVNFVSISKYFLAITSFSIILTWVYNKTKGNIFSTILYHLFINSTFAVFLIFFKDIKTENQNLLYNFWVGFNVVQAICIGFLLLRRHQKS